MDKDEIFRYIKLGNRKSISVERKLLEEYPGILMDVMIRDDSELQIDFIDKNFLETDEGEITFYFQYEDYNRLFSSVEKFLGKDLSGLRNHTRTNLYPVFPQSDLKVSWRKLKADFVNRTLPLPCGYKKFSIRDLYWEALYNGDIKLDDSFEVVRNWMRMRMDEDEQSFEE